MAQARTGPRTAAAADLYNCDRWFNDKSKDATANWCAAFNQSQKQGGLQGRDPNKLDDDRDGYPCEWLAKYRPQKGGDIPWLLQVRN